LYSGNLNSATDNLLIDLINKTQLFGGQGPTNCVLDARVRVLSCLGYLLRGLAEDLCLGDCSRLLQHIDDIDCKNQDDSTALHISAELGLLDSVRSLLMLKADISMKDGASATAVTKAANHPACFRLLKYMEPVPQSDDSVDEEASWEGSNPVLGTLEDVHSVCTKMRVVLAKGFEYVQDALSGPLKWMEEGVIDSVSIDTVGVKKAGDYYSWSYCKEALTLAEPWDCGWSLLMVAAEAGDVAQIRSLIGAKAVIDACTRRQRTALHVAAYAGKKAAVVALLEGKANIEAKDDYRRTPLHVAAEQGMTDVLPLLMHGNPEICLGVQDRKQCNVLHYAATASGDSVRLLVKLKANVEAKGPLQRTALHLAAVSNKLDCLSALLELKANHCVEDEKGKRALDLCKSDSCKYVLKMSGANGWTPLMVACERGGDEIRQYLIENSNVTACFRSVLAKEPFPTWFQEDLVFYNKLFVKQQNWRWGILEPSLVQSANGMQVTKMTPGSPDYSCVLGSEVLEAGIHQWELSVNDVQSMWIGIARGISENQLVASSPTRPGDDGYILAFHSSDCSRPTFYGNKVPRIRSIPNARYYSGDKLTFQLDTKRHILRLMINGALVAVASNVDDVGVRPYVCMDYTESIFLVDQASHAFDASHGGADQSGLNNALWTAESDACLNEFLVAGSKT
jgi:ankyrin repeat protein